MDNPFRVKLSDICARAAGSEEDRKMAVAKCVSFRLSDREDFLLTAVFGPTPDNVLVFLDLYETYLPYVRGATKGGPEVFDWKSANKLDLEVLNLESTETFGWLLRLVFIWDGQPQYEASVREVVRKLEAYTNGSFEFDGLADVWSEIYYRLMVVLMAENLAFLEKPIQMFFIGSKLFVDATIFGIDLDDKINKSVDYYVYLSIRFDQSTDFATFLYANEQTVGFDPETGDAVKLSFWIDKFRIYSDKKFDGLSLINLVQDEKTWGKFNDSFVRTIIKSILMIYGHLVNGYYIYPPAEELARYAKTEKPINVQPAVVDTSLPTLPPVVDEVIVPNYVDIKKMALDKAISFSEDEQPALVINFLSELADKYNDPTIADLYYFDEQSGEFKWRE